MNMPIFRGIQGMENAARYRFRRKKLCRIIGSALAGHDGPLHVGVDSTWEDAGHAQEGFLGAQRIAPRTGGELARRISPPQLGLARFPAPELM